MARRPDAALEVALEQRRRTFEQTQMVFSARQRAFHDQARAVGVALARVQMVLSQIEGAQRVLPGARLAVNKLSDLDGLLRWCEEQVRAERALLEDVRAASDEARGWVATAHQQVRALELVLEARAAELFRATLSVHLWLTSVPYLPSRICNCRSAV